ncbi:MAG: DUF1232 domain-containing protein [Pyrinomonadaceae bacterium]
MAALKLKRRMKSLLMFLPNMIALCGRLITDPRVPRTEKALFAGAIIYAVMPLDFIPDVIPFVGQIDDAYLIALSLLRLIGRTDERVVREHWRGGGDVVSLVESLANLAPALLPKRVHRVLSSQVEIKPEAIRGALKRAGGVAPAEKQIELPVKE